MLQHARRDSYFLRSFGGNVSRYIFVIHGWCVRETHSYIPFGNSELQLIRTNEYFKISITNLSANEHRRKVERTQTKLVKFFFQAFEFTVTRHFRFTLCKSYITRSCVSTDASKVHQVQIPASSLVNLSCSQLLIAVSPSTWLWCPPSCAPLYQLSDPLESGVRTGYGLVSRCTAPGIGLHGASRYPRRRLYGALFIPFLRARSWPLCPSLARPIFLALNLARKRCSDHTCACLRR